MRGGEAQPSVSTTTKTKHTHPATVTPAQAGSIARQAASPIFSPALAERWTPASAGMTAYGNAAPRPYSGTVPFRSSTVPAR